MVFYVGIKTVAAFQIYEQYQRGATININKNHADFDLNDDLGFEAADLVLDTAIVFPVTNTPSEAIFTQKWASVSSQSDFEIFTCYR